MKTVIAASLIACSSSSAFAQSFAYERQFGTPALFPTLVVEQSTTKYVRRDGSTSFAYERQFGTPELFPSLVAEGYVGKAANREAIADKARGRNTVWDWDLLVGG